MYDDAKNWQSTEEIKDFKIFNLREIVTPVNVERLRELLEQVNYHSQEIKYLCDSFSEGFDLGYRGPLKCKDTSQNLPFRVGTLTILWNKIMNEVELGHYTGPFRKIPYQNAYVQSPIGLVPKAGGKTRLIFHLSYKFKNGNESINYWTPDEFCSVKYKDLDDAVRQCLQLMKDLGIQSLYFAKSDLQSAFRILAIHPKYRFLLIMKAKHPWTQELFYFIDKCLPFGSSISCAHFQRFSDALYAIVVGITQKI